MGSIGRYLRAIVALVRREPIRTFSVLRSLGIVVAAFWPGLISPDQQTALLGLAVAWLGVDELVRQQTTSTEAPVLTEGTVVTVTTPPGQADYKTTL